MDGAGKRLLLHTKFLLALFGGGQWLENLAKEKSEAQQKKLEEERKL